MKCYASDYCQKDKSSCSDVCGGYRVLRALYNLSRIPERYRYTIALKPENGEDLEAFTVLDNYKNDVLNMVDEGRGLYIWGKSTGNGKTSWACKIMSYFFRKIAFNTGLENEGLYIFLPTFLEDLRDNYDNKDAPVFGEEAPVEAVEEKQEDPQEKAYTVEEVAQILGCSERNVYRNIQSGKLEAVEREVMIPTLKKFVTEEALEKYKAGRAS